MAERYALIAGNGRFPFLVLEAARSSGRPMLVAAVRQEADPALEKLADGFHWIGLGELTEEHVALNASPNQRPALSGWIDFAMPCPPSSKGQYTVEGKRGRLQFRLKEAGADSFVLTSRRARSRP